MKKFINFNYGFKQNTDYVARARLIKATGFDGVFLYAKYNPETYIGDILGVGLEIGSFHLSYQKCAPDGTKLVQDYVNMLWTDGDESRDYLNLLYSEIEFANKYGIKNIIMHITGGNEPPAFNDNGIRFIGNVLARCKQYGMTLCLENLRRLDYLEKVFKAIDDDCLKFCFDSGHANYMTQNADSFDWEKFGSKLYYLHLNDNDGNSDQHLPPYMGNIDKLIDTKDFIYIGEVNSKSHGTKTSFKLGLYYLYDANDKIIYIGKVGSGDQTSFFGVIYKVIPHKIVVQILGRNTVKATHKPL